MLSEFYRLFKISLGKEEGTAKKTFTRIGPFLFLIISLAAVSQFFGYLDGINEYSSALRFELPYLCIVFGSLLYCMKPGYLRVFVAAAPFILIYIGTDIFYIYMQSVFKFDDIVLLPEGLTISSTWVKVGIGAIICCWVGCFAFLVKRRPKQFVASLLLFALAMLPPLAAYTKPKMFLHVAECIGIKILPWSDRWTSAMMGRTTSLFLFAAEKKKALSNLLLLPAIEQPDRRPVLLEKSLHEKRNIHIVVLESFLDPQQFSKLTFRTPPYSQRFDAIRKQIHIAESPVFGGGTAQAEFEVLCGVPAYRLYSSIEFNALDGTETACLPSLLSKTGYRTVATQSYKPEFFNSEKAYHSLGFEDINFPSVYAGTRKTYLKYDIPDSYIYDGDLFAQNLDYVKQLISNGRPFLNYILGVYGHMPHKTDQERFPPKVDIDDINDIGHESQLNLAIQQFYYRSEAVADYLKKLREIDPKGIILIASDHLPPLDFGQKTYKKFGYKLISADGEFRRNIWIYDGPRQKRANFPTHYYEYMDFLLDALTEGKYCKEIECKNRSVWTQAKLTDSYNSLMVLGTGVSKSRNMGMFAGTAPAVTNEETSRPENKQEKIVDNGLL